MKTPVLLAIDTAGPRLQLALLKGETCDTDIVEIARGHSEILFDRIGALLARNATSYADLTRLAVTVGPGSFTGLRIGLSAARGLALARDIPVVGVPTLLALSLTAPEGRPVTVAIDARRGEAYRQEFSAPGIPDGEPQAMPLDKAYADTAPTLIDTPAIDIEAMARFAALAVPEDWPPVPVYVRAADAKPQSGARIARKRESGAAR